MSSDYLNTDSAVKYSQFKKTVLKKPLEKIFEVLQRKNQKSLQGRNPQLDSLLDVGCGSGKTIKHFASHFKSVTGIDSSQHQINLAKQINPYNNVNYVVGSGEAMPVPANSVDLATFIYSAFFMDVEKVERELARVLKPNGLAVFYEDVVTGIDILEKGSNNPARDTSTTVMDLWRNCLKVFKDYATVTNHPQQECFNHYRKIYKQLNILNSWRVDDVEDYDYSTLDEFLSIYCHGVPFYHNAIKNLGTNPMITFGDQMRKLFNIVDADNKNIRVRITYKTVLIFLEKHTEVDLSRK